MMLGSASFAGELEKETLRARPGNYISDLSIRTLKRSNGDRFLTNFSITELEL